MISKYPFLGRESLPVFLVLFEPKYLETIQEAWRLFYGGEVGSILFPGLVLTANPSEFLAVIFL